MLAQQVRLTRALHREIQRLPGYQIENNLPEEEINIIVLFSARDDELNKGLAGRINATRRIAVSGVVLPVEREGKRGFREMVRLAVGSWRVDIESDLPVVLDVLREVAESWEAGQRSE